MSRVLGTYIINVYRGDSEVCDLTHLVAERNTLPDFRLSFSDRSTFLQLSKVLLRSGDNIIGISEPEECGDYKLFSFATITTEGCCGRQIVKTPFSIAGLTNLRLVFVFNLDKAMTYRGQMTMELY